MVKKDGISMTKHIDLQAKPFALDEAQIQWVEETLAGMTLDEKIGQLFCPIALGPETGQLDTVLDTLHPGGMLFRAMDAKTIQDAQRYLQQKSRIPLLLAANLEAGGNGTTTDGTYFGYPMEMAATDDEIAQALGITEDEFSDWQNQMKITGLVSLDEFVESGADVASSPSSQTTTHFLSPEENIDKKELTEKLSEALSGLSDKEQQIITFYYYEEMTLKEIAQVLDVSESRISQLHTRALKKMKDKLGPYMNILTHSV